MSSAPSAASYVQRPPEIARRLADAQRSLTETLLRVETPSPEALARAEEALRSLAALEAALAPSARGDALPRLGAEPPERRPYYVDGVLAPAHHPLRPELAIAFDGAVTRGRVTFGVTFEGPPGCVHGGFVAHFFDQILGQHNLSAGIPAMTASLAVRYRRATPILRALDFEVTHALDAADGDERRKVTTRAALSAEGTTFAEAEGRFVVPKAAAWRSP